MNCNVCIVCKNEKLPKKGGNRKGTKRQKMIDTIQYRKVKIEQYQTPLKTSVHSGVPKR